MSVLLDANVVLRLASPAIAEALTRLRRAEARICVAPQSCVEAYVVATRPVDANGLGLEPAAASKLVARIVAAFEVPSDPPDLFERWCRVVEQAEVRGVRVHDARLGAFAACYGLTSVVTHNARDFAPFASICGIRVLRPEDVEG